MTHGPLTMHCNVHIYIYALYGMLSLNEGLCNRSFVLHEDLKLHCDNSKTAHQWKKTVISQVSLSSYSCVCEGHFGILLAVFNWFLTCPYSIPVAQTLQNSLVETWKKHPCKFSTTQVWTKDTVLKTRLMLLVIYLSFPSQQSCFRFHLQTLQRLPYWSILLTFLWLHDPTLSASASAFAAGTTR